MPRILSVGAPSRFVTATGWVALVLATAVAVLAGWQLPGSTGVAVAALALMLAASAVGLVLRLEGARRAFIGTLELGLLAALVLLWVQAPGWPMPALAVASAAAVALGLWLPGRLSAAAVRQEFGSA